MPVNALQSKTDYKRLGMGDSTMTVEQAIKKTNVHNVVMAGGFPISRETLAAMPSAKRIVCKWQLHYHSKDNKLNMDYEGCLSRLMSAKELSADDPRIDGFLVDDFSTGSIESGVQPEDLARLQFANALHFPHLPLNGTIYTMSLKRPELPALLPFFAQFLVPLWHADQIDTLPAALEDLSGLSGGKPMLLCIYIFDFGNEKIISGTLMKRQLNLAEKLLLEKRVTGVLFCGTCMMDLDWESNRCLYEWLDRAGERAI
jgi:hypothetical protein